MFHKPSEGLAVFAEPAETPSENLSVSDSRENTSIHDKPNTSLQDGLNTSGQNNREPSSMDSSQKDSAVKDMTNGSPLQTILIFAFPLLLGNLVQQTYNIVDAMIVGRLLGADALAAVGASSSIQFLILGLCIGCCVGFSVPIAQSFGAKDYDTMRKFFWHSILVSVLLAAVMTSASALLCHQILHWIRTPENIYGNAYLYLITIFLGIPFSVMYNLLSSVLRAVGNSRMPFLFLTISAVLNIFLDLFCVSVLRWGCAGAAVATVASQALSGFFCLIYIILKIRIIHPTASDRKWEGACAVFLLKMGLPMGFQYSITAIGSMVMQSANNSLGSIYVSGFTAGMKIKQFLMCPFDALATAAATFAGQNYGARKMDRVRLGLKQSVIMGVSYGLAAGVFMIFCGHEASSLFLSSAAAAELNASAQYLRCMGYFFYVLPCLVIPRQVVQGLGYPGRAVFSGVVEMLARTAFSLLMVPLWGYTAICFTDQTAWVSAMIYIFITIRIVLRKVTKETESFVA